MPEYLAPGVYVEEVSTGSKPIEGVSTSTCGMVGVTERGPENVPILVTSYGDYRRWFGDQLAVADFTDPSGRVHAYLPYSVQGFFTNNGRRNYVVRVLPDNATFADRFMFDRGDATSVDTALLRPAPQDSGTALNPPLLYMLAGTLTNGDWIRVGDGSRAEYRQVVSSTVGDIHISLGTPLSASYAGGSNIYSTVAAYDAGFGNFTLTNDAESGDTVITLTEGVAGDAASLAALSDPILEIGSGGVAEYIRASAITASGTNATVTLVSALVGDLGNGASVRVVDSAAVAAAIPAPSPVLEVAASAGDVLVYPDNNGSFAVGNWAVIGDVTGTGFEIRQVGTFGSLSVDVAAYDDYPARAVVQRVSMADDSQTIAAAPAPTAQVFTVNTLGNLEAGMAVDVQGSAGVIQNINGSEITLVAALAAAPNAGDSVAPVTTLTADANAGDVVLSLANRVGLNAGDVIRVGTNPNEEYLTVAQVSGTRGVAPDAGTVVLTTALQEDYASGTAVAQQAEPTVDNTVQATVTVLPVAEGDSVLYVGDETSFAAANVVRVTTSSGVVAYHRLVADATLLAPAEVELSGALNFSHTAGTPLQQREPLFSVQALDRGAWGNRLLVSVQDLETPLVRANLTQATGINPVIELSNFTGVEAGTVLEFLHPDTGATLGTSKVVNVDRSAGEVTLAAIPDAAVVTAFSTLTNPVEVISREFNVTVLLLQQPDPGVPSRNSTVIDSETFTCSMDPRHSLYIHNVLGTTWNLNATNDDDGNPLRLSDNRSEGRSAYIRVRDVAAGNQAVEHSIRLGPETLIDVLDSGQQRPARHALADGIDAIDTMNQLVANQIYQGIDNNEPRQRTGIFALRNIQDISLVAVPGQTSTAVQQALINHCENDRYRFAVLDAPGPDLDTLADVQAHRQAFDSKYAALYHPWLTIPEPLPANIANIRQLAIPPSGHMLGIYARVDNERGVHKAPANEVVRGITGLTRKLNTREHDILNPFPSNIDVIRDFRENNRGLRVWGARVITSDSDYKYINVRRLLIFIEASIDRGLQWVVFEPNAEPLWARVRRAISNFLTVVWRNGALEGTKPEEAFFVKCDRTTMTQTDIDNGRLICEVGVAPVKPAEYVIVRIGLWTANAQQ